MEMNGLATWRQAITFLPQVIKTVASKSDLKVEGIGKFIFHQANLRLIEYLMKKMKRSMESTFVNVDRIGNTGAASIAIAISEAKSTGFFDDGEIVCLAGVGAGFTFGASLWRWGSINT
jgi:3-oxoacyl-[acyl-carrier-protein] synthase-3